MITGNSPPVGFQWRWPAASKTAAFAGATGTTVSLAGDITIGNLSFSEANYTITGCEQGALSGCRHSTIFVDTGRIATISSKLTSTGEMFKTGNGTFGGDRQL